MFRVPRYTGASNADQTAVAGDFVRPSNWLAIPSIQEGEECLYVLCEVTKPSVEIDFIVEGAYIVEELEGNVLQSFDSGHLYHRRVYYDEVIGEPTLGNDTKQMLLKITPRDNGVPITKIDFSVVKYCPVLEVKGQLPFVERIYFETCSLWSLELLGENNIQNLYRSFRLCNNLKRSVLYTSKCTSFNECHHYNRSLRKMPDYDTSVATDLKNMFHSNYSLEFTRDYDTRNVVDFQYMLSGCRSLKYLPVFDYSSAKEPVMIYRTMESLTEIAYADYSGLKSNTSSLSWDAPRLKKINVVGIKDSANMSGTGLDTREAIRQVIENLAIHNQPYFPTINLPPDTLQLLLQEDLDLAFSKNYELSD